MGADVKGKIYEGLLERTTEDTKSGYSGDMHPVIPAICTHVLNYHFDKVSSFFSNSPRF
jgi:hypothetical protein